MNNCNKCLFHIKFKCELGYEKGKCNKESFKNNEIDRQEYHYLSKEEMRKRKYFIVEEV